MYTINGTQYDHTDMRFIGAWVMVNGTAKDMLTWLEWNDSNGDYEGMDIVTLRTAIRAQL